MTPCQRQRLLSIIQKYKEKQLHPVTILRASEHHTYFKTWLIDSTRNNNGWRVPWESIKKHAKSFVGRPGIEYFACGEKGCMRDHTDIGGSLKETLHKQEPHSVSTIIDVQLDEASETAYAIHHTSNKQFADKIKSGEVKYLSPAIHVNHEKSTLAYNQEADEWHLDTTEWKGLHDAFVDVPAYGNKAVVHGVCSGTESECSHHLKSGTAPIPEK